MITTTDEQKVVDASTRSHFEEHASGNLRCKVDYTLEQLVVEAKRSRGKPPAMTDYDKERKSLNMVPRKHVPCAETTMTKEEEHSLALTLSETVAFPEVEWKDCVPTTEVFAFYARGNIDPQEFFDVVDKVKSVFCPEIHFLVTLLRSRRAMEAGLSHYREPRNPQRREAQGGASRRVGTCRHRSRRKTHCCEGSGAMPLGAALWNER